MFRRSACESGPRHCSVAGRFSHCRTTWSRACILWVMRFARDAVITIAVLLVIGWLALYSRVRASGLAADAETGRVERVVRSGPVPLAMPADARQQKNPFAADQTIWRTAADHYGDHCAACHGNDGRGQTQLGQSMYPKVPDFADVTVQRLSDGELFYIIQNGVRWTGMPSWKGEHSADDTWRLVSFIRAVPDLTDADRESAGLGAKSEEKEHHPHEQHDGAQGHPRPER